MLVCSARSYSEGRFSSGKVCAKNAAVFFLCKTYIYLKNFLPSYEQCDLLFVEL